MTAVRGRALLLSLAFALAFLVAAPAIGLGDPATARGAAMDLTLVTDAVYTVHPDAGHVGVSISITARNHTTETRTRRFWFDHAFLAVQPGATNLRISGPKGVSVRVAKKDAKATMLRIDFGSRLYSGRSAAMHLAFDLPGQGKAASPQVRVGTSLITIPVWAYASTGARGSSVTVRMPAGWDVAVESGSFASRSTGGGETVLASGPIANPLSFFAYVSAQQPPVFVDRQMTLPVGDQDVPLLLRAWEDDAAWATRTGDLFASALPILRRDIGLDWPLAEPLVVEESVSRDAGAYAGIFDPAEGRLEVAYWAGPGVIVHQAAHGWFNGTLLADRWAAEGFATFYGQRAADALKAGVKPPAMTEAAAAGAQPLNVWSWDEPPGSAADTYGYAASYELATALAEQVGMDVLARVWADAAGRIGAYQPPVDPDAPAGQAVADAPESVGGAPDWRRLLDLLEARSGVDLAPLWSEWVIRPAGAPLLAARADARDSYSRTLALAGDWRLPRPIRDALRAWTFDRAEALMADARTVIAQRNALAEMAARDAVTLPGTMQDLFESGALADASVLAVGQRDALLAIEGAAASRSADDDILSRIGMVGEHPEADMARARSAITDGDIAASLAAADRAARAWTVAWQEGRRRALLGIAVLATIVVLGAAVVRTAVRSRRSGPGAVAASAAGRAQGDGPASS